MKKLLIPFVMLAMIFAACGDDNGPSIEITSPADGSTYAPGDLIAASLTASDDIGVTSIDLSFTSDNSTGLNAPLDLSPITDLTSFVYNVDITLDAGTVAGEYELLVTASDADGNTEEDKIKINVE